MKCSSWNRGKYCSITCVDQDAYAFPVDPPLWYSCGHEGFWDPPTGIDFKLPSCAGECFVTHY